MKLSRTAWFITTWSAIIILALFLMFISDIAVDRYLADDSLLLGIDYDIWSDAFMVSALLFPNSIYLALSNSLPIVLKFAIVLGADMLFVLVLLQLRRLPFPAVLVGLLAYGLLSWEATIWFLGIGLS